MGVQAKRSNYWDNIKGLMIMLVVFAHVLISLNNPSSFLEHLKNYIYIFHMPVFVFISGFFGKSAHARSWEALGKFLFLYFIFNSFAGFLYGVEPLLIPKYSYWYLLALVIWRAITPHVVAFKEIRAIVFGLALLVGFFPSIDNTLALARVIGFYPYYVMGYLLSVQAGQGLAEQKYAMRLPRGLAALAVATLLAVGCDAVFHYTDASLQMRAYVNTFMDTMGRVGLYAISFTTIFALRCLTPSYRIPFITLFGRNALWIFLFHRPFTLLVAPLLVHQSDAVIVLVSLLLSVGLGLVFGNNWVANWMETFAADGVALLTPTKRTRFNGAQFMTLCVCVGFVFALLRREYSDAVIAEIKEKFFPAKVSAELPASSLPPALLPAQEEALRNAFRITFAGDLILLEDQVKRGYKENKYDFADVFEYAKPYIASADFAIGVFEGPMAGEAAGYSVGNFDDSRELFLNFPDEFATAVKDAGFDLVTTANNHLLDKGVQGVHRTLDVLDQIGLAHTGSYRSAEEKEKNRVKMVERDGIKMAILSYTYGSNYKSTKDLLEGDLSYATSVISDTKGETFEKIKAQVEQDFKKAKELSPDLILVLPHVGTQFSNQPDAIQETWFEVFKENGADIILGDHPHVVEPVVLEKRNDKTILTAYCPGNFANMYRQQQGDSSILVDVYVDRHTKKVIGASVVPLYTQARAEGNYRALPIFEIFNNALLRQQLSTDDLARAKRAHALITNVLFGHGWDASAITPRYYITGEGFARTKQHGLKLTEEMQQSAFLQALHKADTVCFIGDSITEGTKNEGYPWYEPIEPFLPGKQIFNYSRGGATVLNILSAVEQIPVAQVYVIAIGTNDVRYRNENTCAMTEQDFVNRIDTLRQKLLEKSPHATFVFVAPWYAADGDPFSLLEFEQKQALNEQYSLALEQYCKANKILYINPNPYIRKILQKYPQGDYLLDHIHPNSGKGIKMYAEAVLLSAGQEDK